MKPRFLSSAALGLAAAAMVAAQPLAAEIIESEEDHFITRDEALVTATPKEVWLALISPARWWSSQHTWSADAANLRLTPQAGGCFCERIPESDELGRITLEGSVEHMRVIQSYPEVALRMEGALGPLQSEPVTGILTIALTEVETPDGTATRIVWEYNVGGKMRYEVPVIARAVDGVMSQQLAGLADLLGRVEEPEGEAEGAEGAEEAEVGEADEIEPGDLEDAEDFDLEEALADAEDDEGDDEEEGEGEALAEDELDLDPEEDPEKERGPSVDEAFEDFGDLEEDDPEEDGPEDDEADEDEGEDAG